MSESDKINEHHSRRDGETMIVLGAFMALLAMPVLVATIWAGTSFAMAVNAGSGLVLLGIGAGFIWRGRGILSRLRA